MKIRKLTAALTVLCIIGGTLPNNFIHDAAFAEGSTSEEEAYTEVSVGNALFHVYENYAELTGSKGSLGSSYSIPKNVMGVPVTKIASFGKVSDLKSVTIPDSVTFIGSDCFAGTSVKSVTLPTSLTALSLAAFDGSAVEEIKVASGNKEFISDNGVLFNTDKNGAKHSLLCYPPCKKDTEYTIPSGTNLYMEADKIFGKAKNIKTLIFPADYTAKISFASEPVSINKIVVRSMSAVIDDNANTINSKIILSGCVNSTIDAYAKKYARQFEILSDNSSAEVIANIEYKKYDDHVELINTDLMFEYLVIPDTIDGLPVTKLNTCFQKQKLLQSVVVPDTVTDLDEGAFLGCTQLTSVKLPTTMRTIGKSAFSFCTVLEQIELPENLETIGESAFSNCKKLKSIEVPDSVTEIGDYAFSNCEVLSELKLPNSEASLRKSIAAFCPELKTVKVPEKIKTIGHAFEAVELESIEFSSPDTALSVVDTNTTIRGFNGSKHWTSAMVSKYKFENIGGDYVGNETYGSAVGSYVYSVGYNKVTLDKYSGTDEIVTIPDTVNGAPVTAIGKNAFSGNSAVKQVKMPSTVREIGTDAFANTTSLEKIELPVGMKTISDGAFRNTALTEVKIPAGVHTIGAKAFKSCTKLQTAKLGSFTETIGAEAFYGCTALKSVKIPYTVKTIERNAFFFTKELTDFTCLSNDCTFEDYKGTAFIGSCEGEDDDPNYLPITYTGVLYGYEGSSIEKYASDHDLQFISLGETPEFSIGNATQPTLHDDHITADDASYILRLYTLASSGKATPSQAEFMTCDVNCDGYITADDASLVLRYYTLASSGSKQTLVEFLSDVT